MCTSFRRDSTVRVYQSVVMSTSYAEKARGAMTSHRRFLQKFRISHRPGRHSTTRIEELT
ncbi:hypothetical protein Mapa_015098 [Marchantia paleacea]|nr:hypothetical protein Mapa_015098 [Marchantia paleacea]